MFQTAFVSGDTNKTAVILLSLVEPLLQNGRTLWMDNFYNSPALAKRLKNLKTDCVGTLLLSRKDVKQRVKEKKLQKGEMVAQHSGPVSVLKWKDKKEVTMISSYHGEETRMNLTKCRQAGLAQIKSQVPYRVVPKRVTSLATSHVVYIVFHVLAPCTELLNRDKLRQCTFALSEHRVFWVVSKS